MNLVEYVMKHAIRGDCRCGQCIDLPECPKQPHCGLTINLTLFTVGMQLEPDASIFCNLVTKEHPHWLDGNEHNYLECGGNMGSQQLALMAMGLGHLLGVWQCLCPETILPMMDDETKMVMARSGMVAIQVG